MKTSQKSDSAGKNGSRNGHGTPQVALCAIGSLKPYPNNARTHSEAQIGQIAASIKEFGFTNPLLVDKKGTVLAGHGRLAAAQSLGMAEVPVIRLEGMTAVQRRAYVLADNKLAENAGWDEVLLASELGALRVEDFDLGLLGFDEKEIEALIPKPVVEDDPGALIDRAAELQRKWKTKLGQVWEVGKHRLMCGDATALADVATLLDGKKPVLMVADPPYGVNLDQGWRDRIGINLLGSAQSDSLAGDDSHDWTEAYRLSGARVAFVWHGGIFSGAVAESLARADYEIKQQIVWVKTMAPLSRSYYHWKHEPCWFAVRRGQTIPWHVGRDQVTTWEAASPKHIMGGSEEEKQDHPTQKPAELYAIPMRNHLGTGELSYDPFIGSGTAMVAAEQLNRACYGMEIEPKYVAVCLERLSVLGLTPRLAK